MAMVLRDYQLPTPSLSVSEDWEDPSDSCPQEKKTVLLNCVWDKLVVVVSTDMIYASDARGESIEHSTWAPSKTCWSRLVQLLTI